MDVKLVLLTLAVFSVVFVNADFYFNHPLPKKGDLGELGLKCIPGRTIIKISEKTKMAYSDDSSDDSDEEDYRRTHMNSGSKDDEQCEICVCSTEGKDEYCSRRPAKNVNECIVMARVTDEYNRNIPFDVDRVLANRVRRRDLIYHNDEIPYDITARCYRGVSYYSNDPNANSTDLDVGSDIESLLDYDTRDICFYCICSTNGYHADCISRDPFYCEYFRFLKNETDKGKTRYGKLFKQDRPAYFRQLSYRIRRTMDEGMFEMVENYKSRQSRTGGGVQQCVPFVSKYSTCTDENSCAGCKECNCDEQGQWVCEDVTKCFGMDSRDLDENTVDMAWDAIEETFKKKNQENAAKYGSPHVPRPLDLNDDLLGELEKEKYVGSDVEPLGATNVQEFMNMQMDSIQDRFKRSIANNNKTEDTHAIKFYHTVDEVNEDTLKHSNDSGTITAKKAVANFPITLSRRSKGINGNNSSNPLHIEYKSKLYDHHIADNKIDTQQVDEKKDAVHKKIHEIMKNKTKDVKDKDLSKLIVNELKNGIEIVGDKNSPSVSNITFVRENDTLTAMAFIAGNLLNKLWHLEKDNQDDSIESEVLKHEKIADLVDLFKEPLTIRQEAFLKDALEHLASVMSKGSDDKNNIPLCEQIQKIKAVLGVPKNCSFHNHSDTPIAEKTDKHETGTSEILRTDIKNDAAIAAVEKLDNVMSLIQKYEEVRKRINNVKTFSNEQKFGNDVPTSRSSDNRKDQILTESDKQSLNLYGNILGKITKLLVPKKKHKNLIKMIKSQSIFKDDEDLKSKLKRIYDIDLDNSTFTSKDKVVLDYLLNLRNKKCKITDNSNDASMADGDIIQNLSEFLKVKSFVDLLKLLEPEKSSMTESTTDNYILRTNKIPATEVPVSSTIAVTTIRTTTTNPNPVKNNLAHTKEKLKVHLRAIISDLLELQKATGVNSKDGNIKIAEALPCLYNIINSNQMIADKTQQRMNKVKLVFDSIKEELKFNPETRRANMISEPRPKSAAIWERVIKNAELNSKTRRHFEYLGPKSFDEVKSLMHSLDGLNNDYKNTAISKGVAPQKRLTLLKTIDVDARMYIGILEKVKLYLEGITTLNPAIGSSINSFLDKSILNIKLDEDVMNNLYKHKGNKKIVPKTRYYKKYEPAQNSDVVNVPSNTKTVKLSRDEIINQLIKNRVQFYLKVKELEGNDKEDDINVRLARRILNYLETKNYTIARELFKIFVAQKQQNNTETDALPRPMNTIKTSQKGIMAMKEPLIQFEEDKGTNMATDMTSLTKALMKQLANIKNMRS